MRPIQLTFATVLVGLLLGRMAPAQEAAGAAPPVEEEAAADEPEAPTAEPDASGAEDVLAPEAPEAVTPRSVGVEEIKVTAQRRTQSMQDVPVSVTAFSAAELEAQRMKDLRDVSQYTPNLEIKSSFAASNPTLFIRGVGINDLNANSSSAVAVYYDDIYMNSPAGQLAQLFDVEGVEVLRGPQGSLYGRNASAGAIRVTSRRPSGEFEGYMLGTYGSYDTLEFTAALGAPLVSDWLSGRTAFKFNKRGGITENRCGEIGSSGDVECWVQAPRGFRPFPTAADDLPDEVNRRENWAARALLLLQPPNVDTDWLLNVHASRNTGDAMQFQHTGARQPETGTGEPCQPNIGTPTGQPCRDKPPSNYKDLDGDPFAGDYNKVGPESLETLGASLNGTWSFEGFELTSISGYESNERLVEENSDANPFQFLEVDWGNDAWQASQEFRFTGDISDELYWVAGVYGLYEELNVANLFYQTLRTTLARRVNQTFEQDTVAAAAYGHFSWDLVEFFTLEAGLRFNYERKMFSLATFQQQRFGGPNAPFQPFEPLIDASQSADWNAPTGDVSLSYKPNSELTFYGKYSRGWKGGHFNGGSGLTLGSGIEVVEPESVDAYEIGIRSFWWDRRVMANVSSFYYDYDNLQVFNLSKSPNGIPLQELINANDAEVFGAELDLFLRPLDGLVAFDNLDVRFNFGWLETRYKDFRDTFEDSVGAGQARRTVNKLVDYTGNRLVGAPRFSWSGAVEYDLPLVSPAEPRWGFLTLHYDFTYKDDVFFDPSQGRGALQDFEDPFTVGQSAYWLHNARVGYRNPTENWEISGWVRNIGDEVYKVDAFDISQVAGSIISVIGEPRTYGVTVTFNF